MYVKGGMDEQLDNLFDLSMSPGAILQVDWNSPLTTDSNAEDDANLQDSKEEDCANAVDSGDKGPLQDMMANMK